MLLYRLTNTIINMSEQSITKETIIEQDLEVINNKTDKVEDFYTICVEIVENKGFQLINHILIDMQTANVFNQVWEMIEEETKDKLQRFFNQGMEANKGDTQTVTKLLFSKLWKVVGGASL